MGNIVYYEISLQLIFNFDIYAQVINNMTSEDFRNICIGIGYLYRSIKK